ncbi:MAG: hypothetical protein KGO92_04225 [Bacteroidota bacterium]|nr:hypothetical protein [Bacteroidota bacterium]
MQNSERIKQLLMYYFLIISPLFLLVYCVKHDLISDNGFLVLFLGYIPYRYLTDYYRLTSKGVIGKKDYLKVINPFSTSKYFRELYWL